MTGMTSSSAEDVAVIGAASYEHALGVEQEPIDVLDLPQLYQKPSAATLLSVLVDLSLAPPSWDASPSRRERKIKSEGVPAYLTKIISSPLTWLENDGQREQVWEAAAQRLSERSGRTGMGSLTRTFKIPLALYSPENEAMVDGDDMLVIVLHEPALQEDNLGLKTWASSYLLAKRLLYLRSTLPPLPPDTVILELGAGTGLVGLAAAALFKRHVVLTDLPEIVPNLQRNIDANAATIMKYGGRAECTVLDWHQPDSPLLLRPPYSFPLILAADPIYSPEHPRLLVQTIVYHFARSNEARVVIELPMRDAYAAERQDLRTRMLDAGLCVLNEGEEVGYDDWADGRHGDELAEVRCWWSVWHGR